MTIPRRRLVLIATIAAAILAFAATVPAGAGHTDDARTKNLHPQGHIQEPASLLNPEFVNDIHSDIAFWGKLAFQGNYDGFNIRNIAAPGNPKTVSRTYCDGNQGDLVVWENVLIRSWNSPAPEGRLCDGAAVPTGFEGLHIFDISDPADPVLVGSVATACGSHTATGVPDLANGRLLVYNNGSGTACPWFEVIEVPLANPAAASEIGQVALQGGATRCHDIGVILGDANMAACASGSAANVFDVTDRANPQFLYSISEADGLGNEVGIGGSWHSAAFSWDGDVLLLGWEPGGGGAGECEATDPDIKKSMFFYDSATGAKLGQWVLPRAQTSAENCTIHNFNVVPLPSGRDVVVSGNYQSGSSVVDFTDPANAIEIAFSDPPPLSPFDIGGSWSTYWYNGFIYESDITEGLNVFRFSGNETAGALKLGHLNAQTQEFTLP